MSKPSKRWKISYLMGGTVCYRYSYTQSGIAHEVADLKLLGYSITGISEEAI